MVTFTLTNTHRPKASVIMVVCWMAKRYVMPVGCSLPGICWNTKKHRAKITAQFDGSGINEEIERYEKAAVCVIRAFRDKGIVPNAPEFRLAVRREIFAPVRDVADDGTGDILEYLEKIYIPRYRPARDTETIKKYETALHKLREFQSLSGMPLRFCDVNIGFYNRFRAWFYDIKGFSRNYFGSVIKILKQAYKEARDEDHLHNFTGTSHRDFVTTSETGGAIYLTMEELSALERVVITPATVSAMLDERDEELRAKGERVPVRNPDNIARMTESIIRARNIFLIGCFTGLRVSDFSALEDADISGGRLRIRTRKTGSDIVIPVHPVIRRLLDSGFSLSECHLSEQKINDHIKEACRMAGIDDIVTIYKSSSGKPKKIVSEKWRLVCNHTARRSFATNAAKMGVPLIAIMKILGMKRESTLMKYLRQTMEENADLMEKTAFFGH